MLIADTRSIKSLWDLPCSNSNQWEWGLLCSWFGAHLKSDHVPSPRTHWRLSHPSSCSDEYHPERNEYQTCSGVLRESSLTVPFLKWVQFHPLLTLRFRATPPPSGTPEQSCSQWAIVTFCPMGNFLSGKWFLYTLSRQTALRGPQREEGCFGISVF